MEFESRKKTFYFQAGASSLGGVITGPNKGTITPGASTLLPTSGGGCSSVRDGFQAFDGIVTVGSTNASGNGGEDQDQGIAAEGKHHWRMTVSSTVQNLNLLGGAVTIDSMVIQTLARYWRDQGDKPEYDFTGSKITGLLIGTCPVEVVFRKHFSHCGEDYGDHLPRQICIVESVTVKGECPGITKIGHHILEVAGVGQLVFGEGVKFPGNGPVQVNLLRIDLDTSTGTGDKMSKETKQENLATATQPTSSTSTNPQGSGTPLKPHNSGTGGAPQTGSISASSAVVGGTPIPPV